MTGFVSSLMRVLMPALVCLLAVFQPAMAGTIKLGVLKFGTVSWEADVIKQHGLDKAEGLDLELVELANDDAAAVALQAGSVDVIVTDWVWVTRERAEGSFLTFVPYSTSIGSVILPPDSSSPLCWDWRAVARHRRRTNRQELGDFAGLERTTPRPRSRG